MSTLERRIWKAVYEEKNVEVLVDEWKKDNSFYTKLFVCTREITTVVLVKLNQRVGVEWVRALCKDKGITLPNEVQEVGSGVSGNCFSKERERLLKKGFTFFADQYDV